MRGMFSHFYLFFSLEKTHMMNERGESDGARHGWVGEVWFYLGISFKL